MHEISIAQGILDIVSKEREKHNFSKVTLIEIVCGKYNCLSEEHLTFCFELVAKTPCLEGVKIQVQRLSDKYKCRDCAKKFGEQKGAVLTCPACMSENVDNVLDNHIYLSKIEVE